ncbi:Metallo-dependent phosphatase-like protein [Armillaria nabsnona]|nr:Metallo-dependent phosphatase-like protein [Armillaria nabsnona]
MSASTLHIVHWNDVYRVAPQKVSPKSSDTIDVTQFASMLDNIRDQWPSLQDGTKDGLSLFSGDVFSPSVESSVTRGSHMVPIMNELAPDVSLTGNHDFDFGYPHLSKLIKDTTFPWILSNIIDITTSKVPERLHEFQVFERAGTRIGVIGLVEKEWIGTVSMWPPHFEYRDMKKVGISLSQRLRDPDGEYKCDIIVALTHSRVPNDITLAKDLLALSPSAQKNQPIHSSHGVDLLLGGHDHLYYASKGCEWQGYDTSEDVLGAKDDHGDVLVVKSGTDFRDLSEIDLELESTPDGSVRRKVIKRILGKRHSTQPGSKSSEKLSKLLEKLLSSVSSSLKAPVCISNVPIDVRSQFIRTAESAAGNWFADVIRHAYDDTLCMKGCGGADIVFICAGTLRGDSMYGPGTISLGDILEILPFEDPVVVLELDGKAIWDALEASLETWPAQEGRFPVVSGMRVSWDSRREPGQRVLGVWLSKEVEDSVHDGSSGRSTPRLVDAFPIERVEGGRKYSVVTREYMAQGHDGFLPLKRNRYLVDDEVGQMMSTLVRKYLLGSHFVNKMVRLVDQSDHGKLHRGTKEVVSREIASRKHKHHESKALLQWKNAAHLAVRWARSKAHYRDHFKICVTEDMSSVDLFDGKNARRGNDVEEKVKEDDDDLLAIAPAVDGRLKDVGRE